jgi:hypothetical protein
MTVMAYAPRPALPAPAGRILTRGDAAAAAELLHEIYACHADAADHLADTTGLGDLDTGQLEELVAFYGLDDLVALHPQTAAYFTGR